MIASGRGGEALKMFSNILQFDSTNSSGRFGYETGRLVANSCLEI